MITSIPRTKDRHRRRTTVYCSHISHSAKPPSRFQFTPRGRSVSLRAGVKQDKTRRGLVTPGLAVVVSARKRAICSHITAETSASQLALMSHRRSVGVAGWSPVLAQRAIIMYSLDARSGRPTGRPPPRLRKGASLEGSSVPRSTAAVGQTRVPFQIETATIMALSSDNSNAWYTIETGKSRSYVDRPKHCWTTERRRT